MRHAAFSGSAMAIHFGASSPIIKAKYVTSAMTKNILKGARKAPATGMPPRKSARGPAREAPENIPVTMLMVVIPTWMVENSSSLRPVSFSACAAPRFPSSASSCSFVFLAPTMAISANEHTAFPKTSRTIINNSNHIWPSPMKLLQTIYPDTVFFPFSCLHYTKGNRPITAAEILFQTLPGSFK